MFTADYEKIAMYETYEIRRTIVNLHDVSECLIMTSDIWIIQDPSPELMKRINGYGEQLYHRQNLLQLIVSNPTIHTDAIAALVQNWMPNARLPEYPKF